MGTTQRNKLIQIMIRKIFKKTKTFSLSKKANIINKELLNAEENKKNAILH